MLNLSSSPFGDGWTLQGLEQITSATGGVILSQGGGSTSLWFSGSPGVGANYTSPAGDFSTLTKTSSGYTRTLTDGTQITFNSGGYETATIDLNSLHTTFSYNSYNQLTSVKDPYSGVTTFTYASSGGVLQTIEDPALRVTTLTYTSGDLTGVKQADGSRITYTYDSQQSDDAAHQSERQRGDRHLRQCRARGNNHPARQHNRGILRLPGAGLDQQRDSSQPGRRDLARRVSRQLHRPQYQSHADASRLVRPGHDRPDDRRPGRVTTYDVNSNGLPTISIDRLNRITTYAYDSLGNVTKQFYPDGNSDQYTYNVDSEMLTHTDANGHTTSYTYNGNGDNTVIQDPLNNRTTMTYTSDGMLQTLTDANKHTTTYLYDTQDRLTTVQFPDGTTNLYAYNSEGNVTNFTDGRSNATTYSFDAMNRETGTTDPLGNQTTITYDADGNETKVQAPTPAGQTARTTTYAYDTLNRLTTVDGLAGLPDDIRI